MYLLDSTHECLCLKACYHKKQGRKEEKEGGREKDKKKGGGGQGGMKEGKETEKGKKW